MRFSRLLRLIMNRVLAAERTILLHLKTVGIVLLIFGSVVVSLLAFAASECHFDAHSSAPPSFIRTLVRASLYHFG